MQKHIPSYGNSVGIALMLMLLTLLSPLARAITDEIQVYTDDITKPGEFGLELHINSTPTGRKTPTWLPYSNPNQRALFTDTTPEKHSERRPVL